MWFNLFQPHALLVSVLGPTLNHIPLENRYTLKRSNNMRHVYLMNSPWGTVNGGAHIIMLEIPMLASNVGGRDHCI